MTKHKEKLMNDKTFLNLDLSDPLNKKMYEEKVKETVEDLTAMFHRPPSAKELLEALGIDVNQTSMKNIIVSFASGYLEREACEQTTDLEKKSQCLLEQIKNDSLIKSCRNILGGEACVGVGYDLHGEFTPNGTSRGATAAATFSVRF